MDTYLVGGAVRDKLLGLPVVDKDWVVVGSSVGTMLAQGYHQVGKDFPVFLHPKTKEEYALARQERKSGQGYTGFICDFAETVTLEQDLIRRDLTINAIAQKHDGTLVDPYHGQQDIRDKKLRHVSAAFSEDPLRVLRVCRFAARFAALGFSIADNTLALMTTMSVEGELKTITPERIWSETEKALQSDNPHVYFETLHQCGALKALFPELNALYGVPQTEKWHPEIDTFVHTLLSLQQATNLTISTEVRFAALVHDLGKGITDKKRWPKHHGHENTGKPLVKALCKRLGVSKDMTQLALLTCEFHLHTHKAFELRPATLLKLFKKLDAFRNPERLEKFLLASESDARGRLGYEYTPYPQANYLRQAFSVASKITIKQIDAVSLKGAEIGETIDKAREQALSHFKKTYIYTDQP